MRLIWREAKALRQHLKVLTQMLFPVRLYCVVVGWALPTVPIQLYFGGRSPPYRAIHYVLEGLPNKVLAAEYRTALPNEKTLAAEVERTRRMLEKRAVLKTVRRKQ